MDIGQTDGFSLSGAPSPNEARRASMNRLSNETFDLLIIGGGITGCGAARDAAARGLKVALVEKADFGSGTSSKSTKLIHGGLRYLEHGQLRLVFESVNERKRLMHLARHLVRPLPFLVTNYRGDRRSLPTLDLGLWVYDALCLFGNYRNHRTYGAAKTLAFEPGLKRDGLRGGVLFYDCLTDDARLALENALDAQALGAVAVNYAKAARLLQNASGRIFGAEVCDTESDMTFEVRAQVVVNACGPWSDEVRALAGQLGLLKPTKGVHLVVDSQRLPISHALMLTSPRDGRVVFTIPWGFGRTIVGTTDTFFGGSADQVTPTADDVAYLLETANAYFGDARLSELDVLATWSGLRPLLKPQDASASASSLSREHIIDERLGFITAAGGKLTTYRTMAAELVDRALVQLGRSAPSQTASRPLPGAQGLTESDEMLQALKRQLELEGLDGTASTLLAETYGSRAPRIVERIKADAAASQRLDPELPALLAQVDEAAQVELARTLDDVLSRRVPILLRARDQGLGIAPVVAARLARHFGWTQERVDLELETYRGVVAQSRAFRSPKPEARPSID